MTSIAPSLHWKHNEWLRFEVASNPVWGVRLNINFVHSAFKRVWYPGTDTKYGKWSSSWSRNECSVRQWHIFKLIRGSGKNVAEIRENKS